MLELRHLDLAVEKADTVAALMSHSITKTYTEVYMITQERLKELLHYNPETGVFTRAQDNRSFKCGDVAGSIMPKGYRLITVDGGRYLAHRLAWLYMKGRFPKGQIDHVNGIKDDNRIINLRDVSNMENQRNSKLRSDNKTGLAGIKIRRDANGWEAKIGGGEDSIYLGFYSDFFEACCARKSAENRLGYHRNHGKR